MTPHAEFWIWKAQAWKTGHEQIVSFADHVLKGGTQSKEKLGRPGACQPTRYEPVASPATEAAFDDWLVADTCVNGRPQLKQHGSNPTALIMLYLSISISMGCKVRSKIKGTFGQISNGDASATICAMHRPSTSLDFAQAKFPL